MRVSTRGGQRIERTRSSTRGYQYTRIEPDGSHVHVADADDWTPRHPKAQEVSVCGWCWLGAAHSKRLHMDTLREKGDGEWSG
jgi:hypothetical protein